MIMSLISLAMISAPSNAALPPYYDRVRQINTILDSQEVYNALRGNAITVIEKVGSLNFTLQTGSTCTHNVTLEVVQPESKPGMPQPVGATSYKVQSIKATCLP